MSEYINGTTDILGGSVIRYALNTTTPNQAVIRKIIAGNGISISSTGVDPGTGDVTISIDVSGTGGSGSGGSGGGGTPTAVGTVTSVNMIAPEGMFIVGAPITTAGTISLRLSSGYVVPLYVDVQEGKTAFSWGDHALAGYLLAEADTLNSVTGRGNTTTNLITVGGITATGVTSTIYAGASTRLRTEANNLVFERVASSGFMKIYINQTTLAATAKAYMGYNNATLNVVLSNEHTSGGLELRTQDIIRQQIFASGNIVIGQASPSDALYKVDIFGTVRISSTFTLSSLAGTGDRLVVVDSTGVTSAVIIGSGLSLLAGTLTATNTLTAGSFVSDYDSAITGLRNSSNKVYTLTNNYQTGTTKVYVNGVRYSPGAGNDYTESAANQITFTNAPDSGDLILVDYIKS